MSMDWISVEDELPLDGQAVLVRRCAHNWSLSHNLGENESRVVWRWVAAQFVRGKTAEEVAKTGYTSGSGDQAGNNLVPYAWIEFGPLKLFGQEVSHWVAITDPCKKER